MSDWAKAPPKPDELGSGWADKPPTQEEASGHLNLEPEKSSAFASTIQHGIHGATGGLSDELQGLSEAAGRVVGLRGVGGPVKNIGIASGGPTLDWETLRDAYRAARNHERETLKKQEKEHPTASSIGEFGGMVASPINKAVQGMSLAKAGAALGGVQGFGNSESEDLKGVAIDTGVGTGLGFVGGKIAEKATPYVEKGLEKIGSAGPFLAKMLPLGEKENAAEIRAAAGKLGARATPGMTSASPTIQKLESSLDQSPTIGGWLARQKTNPVKKAMQDATEGLVSDASTATPFESGEAAKKILGKEIEAKFAPHAKSFNDLRQYTKDIPATDASVRAVSRNIHNIPEVKTLELPLARQVIRQLEENPSVDQIKMLRGIVGKAAANAEGNEASAYWQMYAKLGRLEENSLKRGVISSARTGAEGKTIAEGMLGQLKSAKQGWTKGMGDLEELSESARLGRLGSPSAAVDKINSIPSEKLQEKLLPLDDVRQAQVMQKQFPEAFGSLRRARLRDVAENVERDGRFVPGKLLQNTKNINPETEKLLFGDQAPKLDALRSVSEALPDKVGPSGTQQAFDVKGMLSPINQARDLAQYGAYRALSSPNLSKVAAFLRTRPQFANLAENNPEAFNAMVLQFSKRINDQGLSKVAGPGDAPVDENEARQSFLEGN